MSSPEMRETLIERTIAVIANDGLDKTTTKAITAGTGINEAYIYRHFVDKDDLLVNAFEEMDELLARRVMKNISVMYLSGLEYELRCRAFFEEIWRFLLDNRENCLAYVQYYYSPYFSKFSAENHRLRYAPIIEKFSGAFREEADVEMILNHILNVMLDFAVMVHNDRMSDNDDYTEHIFRVLYRSVEQYFRKQ